MRCPRRLLGLLAAVLAMPSASGEDRISFNKDIRPILSDACFQCHGPDEAKRKGGLRLDVRSSATAKLDSDATAIVPGKSAESELVKRIVSNDAELRMPPDNVGKKLTPAQIELLKMWIESGAEYQDHWAFRPVEKPKVPAGSLHPVDAFVRDRLATLKLKPMPEASRETLLRRVTLDLTGLPPTVRELDDFLADKSPNAYEKVVDRLLMSPRYGEHMAQQWLDFARYADSNGFQTDSSRSQWPWRDWVIRAFNENKPFDEFTVEQIAGDLLPNARRDQIVATGFNRNHRLNGEGGLIAEEWRIETVIDRVETTGSTWLGLTFNCCRCHDHKYDPISQKEFYQFYAFFNNNTESGTLQGNRSGGNTDPAITLPSEEQERELAKIDGERKVLETKMAELTKDVPKWQAEWEPGFRETLKADNSAWRVLAPKSVKSTAKTKLTQQADGSYLASGKNPAKDTYEVVAPLAAGTFTGLLLEVFPDPSLPAQSVGRHTNGNFALSTITAEINAPSLKSPIEVKFTRAQAEYSQPGYDAANLVGTDRKKSWAVDGPTRKENNKVMVVADAAIEVPANATITVRLIHDTLPNHNIGRFRLSTTSAPVASVGLNGQQVPELVRKALELSPEKRNEKQAAELRKFFLANAPTPIREVEKQIAALQQKQQAISAKFPSVMIMKEMPKPRDAHILIRGQYDKKGDLVTAGLPSALPAPKPGEPMNRLGLARWLVQENNPLTARVWVNRAWERFFGTGLVKTSENMGSQAEYPSHPELLDWLAAEFMKPTSLPTVAGQPAHAWDMKAMHKLLVMSETYRQSAKVTKELLEVDPENRLLARGPRFRLPAEVLRDQSLFLGGLLVEKIGGPSVRPYMPEGVWDETSRYGDLRGYKPDTGEGLYRRTMYTIWKRTAAPPSMLIFDAPSREYCTVKRSRTNTPLQALSLLNEITYVEASRKFAERMLAEGGTTPAGRLRYGFRMATSRLPTADEERILLEGLNADLAKYRAKPAAAAELLKFGASPAAKPFDPAEVAAYALTANVLLNLDEVVTR
jgi:hypothetical protein